MKTISINQFKELYDRGAVAFILDVRTPAEYHSAHLKGAINIPLDRLDPLTIAPEIMQAETVYIICQSGSRSLKACQILNSLNNVVSISGGTLAAESSGLEIIKGQRKVIGLERQVRIAAGALVLLGVLLALYANFYFIYLCAFVGAGLIFAGVTDTCGMAILLGKMPWNQRCENE